MENEMKTSKHGPLGLKMILMGALVLFVCLYLIVLTRNELAKHPYIGRSEQQIYTISIAGKGEVTAVPDIAQISLGVQTESKDVVLAQTENTRKMNDLIDELKALDIAKEDIKTTSYNIYPNYDYNDGRQTLRGYQVHQSVNVKIRDLEKIGDVLSKAGELGANQVGGLNFTIDEPEELKQQAREEALKNAKEKAEALAEVAGVKLGKLVSFNESSDGGYPIPIYADFAVEARGLGGAAAPEIEPGNQDITVNVTVTYEVL